MSTKSGWAWGASEPNGEWLTILGSHWASPKLAATAEEAVKHEAWDQEWNRERATLAHVTEVYHPGVASGRAYRITKGTAIREGK